MSQQIRFLADENFDVRIVVGLRSKHSQIDIQTAREAGILGLHDPLVLTHAAAHNQILLSHDLKTIPGHLKTFLASGNQSPGIFLLAQTFPIGQAITELLMIWEASSPEEWQNQCTRLPL
ncbi:MAG TPA: DUF5615 family PIN-like protein [Ktedonobacterales bacterium]|jgi:hypothetical protein